ncbi:MAG TPA: FtsX-like permease family protein [Gammaproteobacteria bacterium]|nr:FtsX-like permease family protein [Gammaproteobacteria bacterium]
MFALRTSLVPESLAAPARAVLAGIDLNLALYDAVSMDVHIARSLGPQRTPRVLTLVFAVIALTLAIVGIYGVLTSSVTQRVAEIGVRVALGAGVADVVRMIVAEGGRLVAIGAVVGSAAAVGLGRLLASRVQEVRPFEPAVRIRGFQGCPDSRPNETI